MRRKRPYDEVLTRACRAILAAVHTTDAKHGHLEALALLCELEGWLAGQVIRAGASTYQEGFTWDEIGEAIGITKQSARERFLLPTRSPRSQTP